MLSSEQVRHLVLLSLVLWAAATLYIRLLPGAFTGTFEGPLAFAMTVPIAWLTVRLIKRVGRLDAAQLLPGVAVVGATTMSTDGLALEFMHQAYGSDEATIRLGAGWLLWGYGLCLTAALLWPRTVGHSGEPKAG